MNDFIDNCPDCGLKLVKVITIKDSNFLIETWCCTDCLHCWEANYKFTGMNLEE